MDLLSVHRHRTAGPADSKTGPAVKLNLPLHAGQQPDDLRLLVGTVNGSDAMLPDQEKNLIIRFARETGRKPVWLNYDSQEELRHLLASKQENIVLTTSRPMEEEAPEMIYTIPWGMSRQEVVVRNDTTVMRGIADLTTRQVYIKRSSPAWPILNKLAATYAGMDIQIIPESMDVKTVLDRTSSGQYDVVVMDSLQLEAYLKRFLDLEVAFNLTDDEPLSWGVSARASDLHSSLNRFLNKVHLTMNVADAYREDLYGLKARKKLRLITCQGPGNYFYKNGHLAGFEYEFLKRFARNNNMRLEVIVADSQADMLDLLLAGKGDVIAAAVPSDGLDANDQIKYTRPYNFALF